MAAEGAEACAPVREPTDEALFKNLRKREIDAYHSLVRSVVMMHGPVLSEEVEDSLRKAKDLLRITDARASAEMKAALLSPDVLSVICGGDAVRGAWCDPRSDPAADEGDALSDATEDDERPPVHDPAQPFAKRARLTTGSVNPGLCEEHSQASMFSDNEMALLSQRVVFLRAEIQRLNEALATAASEEQKPQLVQAVQRYTEQLREVVARLETVS
eukprot:Rhum_TRINITY_DN1174_c0_g1::Rhum_TRINITY_DN1174_c0_g1_i1::g.3540::m.3540